MRREAEALIEEHRTLIREVEFRKNEAYRLIELGESQQRVTDELLVDAHNAREIAREALAKAERLLDELQRNLTLLKGTVCGIHHTKVVIIINYFNFIFS